MILFLRLFVMLDSELFPFKKNFVTDISNLEIKGRQLETRETYLEIRET